MLPAIWQAAAKQDESHGEQRIEAADQVDLESDHGEIERNEEGGREFGNAGLTASTSGVARQAEHDPRQQRAEDDVDFKQAGQGRQQEADDQDPARWARLDARRCTGCGEAVQEPRSDLGRPSQKQDRFKNDGCDRTEIRLPQADEAGGHRQPAHKECPWPTAAERTILAKRPPAMPRSMKMREITGDVTATAIATTRDKATGSAGRAGVAGQIEACGQAPAGQKRQNRGAGDQRQNDAAVRRFYFLFDTWRRGDIQRIQPIQ